MGSLSSKKLRIICRSPEETTALGRSVASVLEPGDLLLLTGGIGSGKTTFAQGVGRGLGVFEPITSPSFVIQAVHDTDRLTFSHVDLYRLATDEEVEQVGWEDYLETGVTVVEWADRYSSFPEPQVTFDFTLGTRDDDRIVLITGSGQDLLGRVLSILEPSTR